MARRRRRGPPPRSGRGPTAPTSSSEAADRPLGGRLGRRRRPLRSRQERHDTAASPSTQPAPRSPSGRARTAQGRPSSRARPGPPPEGPGRSPARPISAPRRPREAIPQVGINAARRGDRRLAVLRTALPAVISSSIRPPGGPLAVADHRSRGWATARSNLSSASTQRGTGSRPGIPRRRPRNTSFRQSASTGTRPQLRSLSVARRRDDRAVRSLLGGPVRHLVADRPGHLELRRRVQRRGPGRQPRLHGLGGHSVSVTSADELGNLTGTTRLGHRLPGRPRRPQRPRPAGQRATEAVLPEPGGLRRAASPDRDRQGRGATGRACRRSAPRPSSLRDRTTPSRSALRSRPGASRWFAKRCRRASRPS